MHRTRSATQFVLGAILLAIASIAFMTTTGCAASDFGVRNDSDAAVAKGAAGP